MKGLLRKDFYGLWKYLKTSLALLFFLIVLSIFLKSVEYAMFMCLFFSVSMIFSGLGADEQNHWESYALTMPFNRKQIVLEKYIFSYLLIFSGFIFSVLVGGIMTVFLETRVDGLLNLWVLVGSYLVIVISLVFPIIIKKGAEKSRYFFMIIVIIPVMLVALFAERNILSLELINSVLKYGIIVGPILGIAAIAVSYFISRRIFEKKEL